MWIMTAVMAAAAVRSESSNGGRTFHFRMDQPIPSYLFALAVGDLVSREIGPRSRVYAEPSVADAAAWEFDRTEAMLVEAEMLFGPYTWERYDMLVLPPSFPYGGMENPRLTFLTPTMIVGDRSLTNLIAHELAHSWTGNLVTNATWEDFWLNEGWTTLCRTADPGALEGEAHAMLAAATGRNTSGNRWRASATMPTRRLKFSQPDRPESVVSYIAYEKGYAFLVRLERAVGRRAFEAFALGYIGRHRFHSITTEVFLEELRRELPEAARQVDLHRWVYEPGLPADAPSFESPLIDAVSARLFDFQEGRLRRAEVASWSTEQTTYSSSSSQAAPARPLPRLGAGLRPDLPRPVLSLTSSNRIRSGYRPVLPRAEELISHRPPGHHPPVFQAMVEAEWTRSGPSAV
jgi:aminopeptidase N